jgi:N-formylglutamate amidohydrolase
MVIHDRDLWFVERGGGPLIATAIHNGHDMRPEVAALSVLDETVRLREEDPFTGRFTDVVPTWINASRSRFEVDLNRAREDAVYRKPSDAWGLDLWREPLGDALVAKSLAIYDGFYALLRDVLEEAQAAHGRFVVLDLHSYNHRRAGADQPPSDASANPEVNVGTGTVDRERWGHLVDRFMEDLRSADVNGRRLDVRENVRFLGGYMSRWVHETFPQTGCVLAIEFKKVFMDEWTGVADDAELAGLSTALAATVPGLIESLG